MPEDHSHTRDWRLFFGRYARDDTVLAALVQHWTYHQPAYERLRRVIPPGGGLLDVGCGVGPSVIYLGGSGYRAEGIDRDPQLVARAAELTARLAPTSHVSLGDALALPYSDDSFDACFSLGVLEHFDDETFVAALREQRRVAKVVLTVLPTPWTKLAEIVQDERFFSRRRLAELHRRAGLEARSIFGYGAVASSDKMLHRFISRVLPAGLLLILERRFGYAMQVAVLAERSRRGVAP